MLEQVKERILNMLFNRLGGDIDHNPRYVKLDEAETLAYCYRCLTSEQYDPMDKLEDKINDYMKKQLLGE